MDRETMVLAAMYPADQGRFSPVQIQKLLFLIHRNISEKLGGSEFDFEPYDYGPFDREVYSALRSLALEGYIEIDLSSRSYRTYELTMKGKERARQIYDDLPKSVRNYLQTLVEFVCSLSFSQLVRAIYEAYPEMKVNSVFQD